MSQSKPYVSLVVTSRNDNHGGDLLRRMDLFLSHFVDQCRRFNLESEVIIVEWNPPENIPSLLDVLHWPIDCGPVTVRIIEVPNAIHRTFPNAEKISLFQMIAKNVGIRRAEGKFILATNIDILFPDELIEWISLRKLEGKTLYRTDRYDILFPSAGTEPFNEVQDRIIRINQRNYTKAVREKYDPVSFFFDYILIYLHRSYRRLRYREPILHLNSAGDFTLMSREDWFLVRGYPEFPIFSLHLDGVLCYTAYYNNIHEAFLRNHFTVYHLDHKIGTGCTPGKGSRILLDRLRKEGIPNFRYRDLIKCADELRSMEKPVTFNQTTWGLGDLNLGERKPRC